MTERWLVLAYLLVCVVVGALATRRVLGSADEYWVAGRRVGTWVNALAIMAALASGGSLIGVLGLAYRDGIPATLALFAGAVVGFPLATILVAAPLRRLAKFTITDFMAFRYPHGLVRALVPLIIVVSLTVYMVAQMKAAGITAEALLGVDYETAITVATVVFVLYVSFGGMVAVTVTDVMQGGLLFLLMGATAVVLALSAGSPLASLEAATAASPAFGQLPAGGSGYLDYFVIWASAIPVIPHIVMRVATARDPRSARLSLNLATVMYGVMILSAILLIAPVGILEFPGLTDPDQVFLRIVGDHFPPVLRGLAVAAVLAAVMSTTDAFLLAVSSAVAHDLLGGFLAKKSKRTQAAARLGATWLVGAAALYWAFSPPELLTRFYTAGVGLLSAGLFVPVVFGIWWRRANLAGGVAALVSGVAVYSLVLLWGPQLGIGIGPILVALPVSLLAMLAGGFWGGSDPADRALAVARLHGER